MERSLEPSVNDRRLWEACRSGDVQAALAALNSGASGWLSNIHGVGALAMAAAGPDDEKAAACVAAIVKYCDPLARDAFDQTPLMAAAKAGNFKAASVLIPWCDPLAMDASGRRAFNIAHEAGFAELTRLLLGAALSRQEQAAMEREVSINASPARPARL